LSLAGPPAGDAKEAGTILGATVAFEAAVLGFGGILKLSSGEPIHILNPCWRQLG